MSGDGGIVMQNVNETEITDKIEYAVKKGKGARLDLGKDEYAEVHKVKNTGNTLTNYYLVYKNKSGTQTKEAFSYDGLKHYMAPLGEYKEWRPIE